MYVNRLWHMDKFTLIIHEKCQPWEGGVQLIWNLRCMLSKACTVQMYAQIKVATYSSLIFHNKYEIWYSAGYAELKFMQRGCKSISYSLLIIHVHVLYTVNTSC